MNSNIPLIVPDGLTLASGDNSFVSNWADKRSAPYFGVSVVLRGTGTIAGSLTIETSNALEGGQPGQIGGGGGYGQPAPGLSGTAANPDDALTYPGSATAVSQSATTPYQWSNTTPIGARWVRVRYTAETSSSGITASCYFNGVFSS